MAKPTAVSGLRSAASRDIREEQGTTALPGRKEGRYQFRSRNAALVLSLRRRRTSRGPDGELIEESARTKADNPIDWIRFENNYYETADPEIAEAIRAKQGFGVGREFWDLAEEKAAQDVALEEALRRQLAERPDIAARVLQRSNSETFELPPPRTE